MDRKTRCAAGCVLACSMAVTVGMLYAQGRVLEALPLHLCSLSALAAVCLSVRRCAGLLDFLWYLGMPGALLALIFPAPAVSSWQGIFDFSYAVTHAMILVIPLLCVRMGERPRLGQTARMMMVLQIAALAASLANHKLGTDFLFLAAPPAGTPLEWVFSWGYDVYLVFLEMLMLMVCRGMEHLCRKFFW